ncbi:MAG: nuclear transport factor 2 family protein [Bacteroidota bacterium]
MTKVGFTPSALFLLTLILTFCLSTKTYSQNEKVKSEILRTGELIRAAFSKGDIEAIKSFHHPDVIKALGYKNLQSGRDAVIDGLRGTLEGYTLDFVENNVESILIQGDIAIEQTLFSIKGTPKKGGEVFIFSGRTMVTYIKYKKSPTGWATIREIIQQATN